MAYDHLGSARYGDRQQGADHPTEQATGNEGDNDQQGMEANGSLHDLGHQDVGL